MERIFAIPVTNQTEDSKYFMISIAKTNLITHIGIHIPNLLLHNLTFVKEN